MNKHIICKNSYKERLNCRIARILISCILGILTGFVPNGKMLAQYQVDSSRLVKVLTFNILHGATTRGDFNLDTIAAVINEADPDFVALQEVDFKTRRAMRYDLVTELGYRTGMAPVFARAMPYDGGEYGEGVLSRYSFLETRNIPLPFSPGNEPRAALEIVTILPSGDTIAFVGTHLDHTADETDRISQANRINEVFKNNRYPTILAGDLNAVPGSRPIQILENMWTASSNIDYAEPTFPSENPVKKIDYVMYYPKSKWQVVETHIICDRIASDHCAYLALLQIVPSE